MTEAMLREWLHNQEQIVWESAQAQCDHQLGYLPQANERLRRIVALSRETHRGLAATLNAMEDRFQQRVAAEMAGEQISDGTSEPPAGGGAQRQGEAPSPAERRAAYWGEEVAR